MDMNSTLTTSTTTQDYMPIYLDCIRVDSVLGFDLYLQVDERMVLYRSADLSFTEATRRKLLENRVNRLYVPADAKTNYQQYIEKNLDKVLADPEIQDERKAAILYETSTGLVRDVLSNPTYGENIRRSKELVGNTVGYILHGREAFLNLLKITSFDYYTYTHSVNVCTFSIALAQQLGMKDKTFLHDLGTGALLHDVGKSKISDRVLNKQSALTPYEFEIVKQHPKWGIEILTETDELSSSSYYPVLQHHERGDRSGYPNGLDLEEMHVSSRIVSIADSFDAMTSERVYQRAIDTFACLKILFSLKDAYDERLLRAFTELMGPTGLAK